MKFEIALIDPPWYYEGDPNKMGAAAKEYPLIPDAEMLRLPIASYLERKSILFVWATCPRVDFAIECIKSWGLYFRGVSFIWIKTKQDGVTPIKAQGVRPSIVKPLTEFVLAASFVKSGRPLKLHDESIIQTIFAPKTSKHSEKPEEVYARIEAMYPTSSKVEIFARKARKGWKGIGNELDGTTLKAKKVCVF